MSRRTVRYLLPLFLVMSALSLPVNAQDAKGKTTGKTVPFTIDQQSGWLILSATVDGKGPVRIVFDTGASESFLNPSAYRQYSLNTGKHKVKMNDLEFETGKFQPDVQDIPGLDGIMGIDVISQFVCTLDIGKRQIVFFNKNSWKSPSLPKGSKTKKCKYTPIASQGVEAMGLSVSINDKGPLKVVVDTGSPAACWLLTPSAQKVGLPASQQPIAGKVKIADGVEVTQGVIMTIPQPNLEQAATMLHIDGVLGGNFLKDFIVTFDPVNKEIIFEPVAAPAPPQKGK